MDLRKYAFSGMLLVVIVFAAPAQADDIADLQIMLDHFLAGASYGKADVHDAFWHPDLIYTSSNGTRTDKASILDNVRNSPPIGDDGPSVIYTAEDVQIKIYGDTAIVAFKLVGTPQNTPDGDVAYYLNTGTFLRADDGWSVIAWQATRIPDTGQDNS